MTRIDNLKSAAFTAKGFNGYLIFNCINQLYFLGVPGTSALLIPQDGKPTAYVSSVNYEQAKAQIHGVNVQPVPPNENLMAKIAAQARSFKIGRLAVDALGADSWRALVKELVNKTILELDGSYVQALRAVKDAQEIELMRKAAELTSEGMKAARDAVKPGVKEYEVAAEAEYAMRKRGSGPVAFESIVASGVQSAFPHGGCSEREIREGDLVVVDIGATYQYYCSDMTRTFVAGKPTEKQQRLYDIVKSAHDRAFEVIKAGTPVAEVDAAGRNVIEAAGYGDFFVHRLGHNVGLEVHEPPSLNCFSKAILAVGNVVTDEPGIYLPDYGGVRVEDTVLVGRCGAEKLTVGPYGLNGE